MRLFACENILNQSGVRLVNRIFSAVKMFQLMPVNRLTDGEICFQIYNMFMKVSINLVVYKGSFKNQLPKMAYIDTNTKDRIV